MGKGKGSKNMGEKWGPGGFSFPLPFPVYACYTG